jgi:hypothetical protein
MYNLLHSMVGTTPVRLFLRAFPPYGESNTLAIDIAVGLVFPINPTKVLVISTDKGDLWSPHIAYTGIPEYIFDFSQFKTRMEGWMHGKNLGILDYEVAQEKIFRHIVAHKILSIQFIKVKSLPDPLGVKLLFSHDYIISSPIADGNTIETKYFSLGDNLAIFRSIGELELVDIQKN